MKMLEEIQHLVDELIPICEKWIHSKDEEFFFIDPLDGKEIAAHYGATHIAVALIIYGFHQNNQERVQKGILLLKSVLGRWNESKKLPGFHSDFQNFALCVVDDALKNVNEDLRQKIKKIVMDTDDSVHNTTNWLPMRWYVNKKRFEWSNKNKYQTQCEDLKRRIKKATNRDGGIEDRMPKGTSFNLQYDVATVSVLQFLRNKGEVYDLGNEMQFLLSVVAPDGDINYQGRGMNQIFAWGLWIYLLASSSQIEELRRALIFLDDKVHKMFERNNLMLNNWDGREKYWWWDYHYCSVYSAHFIFWLVLSITDYCKTDISLPKVSQKPDTGIYVFNNDNVFVSSFSGRKEYLSEKGPVVTALWTKRHGMIVKGSFGPWMGAFGLNYSTASVLNNYFGIYDILSPLENMQIGIIRKIIHYWGINIENKCKPDFCPFSCFCENNKLVIVFNHQRRCRAFLNIPVIESAFKSLELELYIDDKITNMFEVGIIKNQFGLCHLIQSNTTIGQCWRLEIKY